MTYFTIVLFCTAGLFLVLLEDRFRIWITIAGAAVTYLLSMIVSSAVGGKAEDPVSAGIVSCTVGCLLFFAASLILFTNNPLQKFFLAMLSLSNYLFMENFIPVLLGAVPFSPAGASGGFLSVSVFCLFYLLTGLFLYRPIRHYSDRGGSGFLIGVCFLLVFLDLLCLGKLDFLFRTNIPAVRILVASILYIVLFFAFRSIYQAGRFREKAALEAARERMLFLESGNFDNMASAIREIRSYQKNYEYAMDTINAMLSDGDQEKIPAFIGTVKQNAADNPYLPRYHDDPHINAVLASKAAFAAQNGIAFESNVVLGDSPLTDDEICVMIHEILTRATREAAEYNGDRKVRLTVFPTERSLRFEAVYSAESRRSQPFTLKDKNLSDVFRQLLEDNRGENELHDLETTSDIIGRYSGKLAVSNNGGETVLQAHLRF